MIESELILVKEEQQPPSIFHAPVDTEQVTRAWEQARSRYLHYVYTRHGTEEENLRPNTRRSYETALSQFFDGIEDRWSPIPYWQVNIGVAQAWKDALASSGLSAASVKLRLAALKGFYDFISNVYQVPYNPHLHDPYLDSKLLFLSEDGRSVMLWNPQWRNPFNSKAIQRGKATKKPVYLTTDEVARIISKINTRCLSGKRDFALVMALWSTACRSSEILNLKWGDLVEAANGNYVFSFRGKSGKAESVEMDKRIRDWICLYLEATGRLADIQPDDYIFVALDPARVQRLNPDLPIKTNEPLTNQTANGIIKKYARRAGVSEEKAHLHALRHGRARNTLLNMKAKNGVPDVYEIKQLLRHSSLDMTYLYIEIFDEPEDKWADGAINDVVSEED